MIFKDLSITDIYSTYVHHTARNLTEDPWLQCQVKLFKDNIITDENLEKFFYLDRVEGGFNVYSAVEMSMHKHFDIYILWDDYMELEIEIETF